MEIGAELAALIDDLGERHPAFRRTTIERLVVRTAHELGDVPLTAVEAAANEQLTYVDGVDGSGRVRRSG